MSDGRLITFGEFVQDMRRVLDPDLRVTTLVVRQVRWKRNGRWRHVPCCDAVQVSWPVGGW